MNRTESDHLRSLTKRFLDAGGRAPAAPDELLEAVARMAFVGNGDGPVKQSEIMRILGFANSMQVSRLLKRAEEEGIVTITVRQRTPDLAKELQRKFGLKEVHVLPFMQDYDEQRRVLGERAAEVLDARIEQLPMSTVALGSGHTLYEMIHALPQRSRMIDVAALTLFTRLGDHDIYDAPFLAMGACWKSQPGCTAHTCALPPLPMAESGPDDQSIVEARMFTERLMQTNVQFREVFQQTVAADLVFTGIRIFKEGKSTQIAHAKVGIAETALDAAGVIGDLNFNYFNDKGENVTSSIYERETRVKPAPQVEGQHPFLPAMSLNWFKKNAKGSKFIYLVAGGVHKQKAILVAVKHKFINGLITDEKTARFLLVDGE